MKKIDGYNMVLNITFTKIRLFMPKNILRKPYCSVFCSFYSFST